MHTAGEAMQGGTICRHGHVLTFILCTPEATSHTAGIGGT